MVAVQSAADSFSDSKSVITRVAQLVAALQPGCEKMERKWRENEKMKRKWKESEEMERVVRACLVPIFLTTNPIDTIPIDTCSLQGPILQYFQHCCLCPLPKIKEKRNTHFMFCVTKVFALIQKLLVLCNVQPHNRMQCHGFYFFSLCRKDSPAFLLFILL